MIPRGVDPAEASALPARDVQLVVADEKEPGAFAERAVRSADRAVRKKLGQREFSTSCSGQRGQLPLLVELRQKLPGTILLVKREELAINAQKCCPGPTRVDGDRLLGGGDIREAPTARIIDVPFQQRGDDLVSWYCSAQALQRRIEAGSRRVQR